MAFTGTLIRMGGSNFPLKWMDYNTYKITPNRRQDLDPFRNANGYLMRNVVEHAPTTIDFELRPMYNNDVAQVMAFIRKAYTNVNEKKLIIDYYDPEFDDFRSGEFYLDSNVEFPIKHIDVKTNKIKYDSIKLSFVQY